MFGYVVPATANQNAEFQSSLIEQRILIKYFRRPDDRFTLLLSALGRCLFAVPVGPAGSD
jgi:hypothetical protein